MQALQAAVKTPPLFGRRDADFSILRRNNEA
jgi:hypothetical protein